MRRRSGSSAASRSIACASAAGLSGGTRTADSPSASSSRGGGGVRGDHRARRSRAPRRRPAGSPATRESCRGRFPRARARSRDRPARSRPARRCGRESRSSLRRLVDDRGRRVGDLQGVERVHRRPRLAEDALVGAEEDGLPSACAPSCDRWRASASLPQTTRSGSRRARKSTARRTFAAVDRSRKRRRTSTSSFSSESTASKTSGRPRANRRARGTSKWPG